MNITHEYTSIAQPRALTVLRSPPQQQLCNPNTSSRGVNPHRADLLVLSLLVSPCINSVDHSHQGRLLLLRNFTNPTSTTAFERSQGLTSSSASPITGVALTSLNPSSSSSSEEYALAVHTPYVILKQHPKGDMLAREKDSKSHHSTGDRHDLRSFTSGKRTGVRDCNDSLPIIRALAIQICAELRGEISEHSNASPSDTTIGRLRGGEVITINMGASGTGKTHFLLGSAFSFFNQAEKEGEPLEREPNASLLSLVMETLFSVAQQREHGICEGQKCPVEVAVSAIELNDAVPFSSLPAEHRPTEAVDLLSGRRDVYTPESNSLGHAGGQYTDSYRREHVEGVMNTSYTPTGCFMENWTDIPAVQYVRCSSAAEVDRVVGAALSRSLSWRPVRADQKGSCTPIEVPQDQGGEPNKRRNRRGAGWFLNPDDRKEHGHLLFTFLVQQRQENGETGGRDIFQNSSSLKHSVVGIWRLWDLCGPLCDDRVTSALSASPSSCSDASARTFSARTFHALDRWTRSLAEPFPRPGQAATKKVNECDPCVRMIQACVAESCSMCIFVASLVQDVGLDNFNEVALRSAAAWQAWATRSAERRGISEPSASRFGSQRWENIHAARLVLKKFALSANTYLHQLATSPYAVKTRLGETDFSPGFLFTSKVVKSTSIQNRDRDSEEELRSTTRDYEFQDKKKNLQSAMCDLNVKVISSDVVDITNFGTCTTKKDLMANRSEEEGAVAQSPQKVPSGTTQHLPLSSSLHLRPVELSSAMQRSPLRVETEYHSEAASKSRGKLDVGDVTIELPLPIDSLLEETKDMERFPSVDFLFPTPSKLTSELQYWTSVLQSRLGDWMRMEMASLEELAAMLGSGSQGLPAVTNHSVNTLRTKTFTADVRVGLRENGLVAPQAEKPELRGLLGKYITEARGRHAQQYGYLLEALSKTWDAIRGIEITYSEGLQNSQREMEQLQQSVMSERAKSKSLHLYILSFTERLRAASQEITSFDKKQSLRGEDNKASTPSLVSRVTESAFLREPEGRTRLAGSRNSEQPTSTSYDISIQNNTHKGILDDAVRAPVVQKCAEKRTSREPLESPRNSSFASTGMPSAEVAELLSSVLSKAFRSSARKGDEQDHSAPIHSNTTEPLLEVYARPWPDRAPHDEGIAYEDRSFPAATQDQAVNFVERNLPTAD